MMLTIHGLPPRTTFQTLKTLIKQECNIIDFILDNLIDDGPNSKKVRIGVSDDNEGFRILKCLDGFRMSPTHLLKIVPVGKQLLNKPEGFEQRNQGPGFQNQRPDNSNNEYNRGPQGFPDRHPGPGGDRYSDGPGPGQFRPMDQRGHPDQRNVGPQGDGRWGPNGNSNQRGGWNPGQNQNQPQGFNRPEGMGPGFGQQQHQGPPNTYQGRGPPGPQDTFNQNRGPPGPDSYGRGPQGPQDTYGQGPQDNYGQNRPQDQRYGFQAKPNLPVRNDMRANNLRPVEIVDTPRHAPYQQDKPITIMKDNFQGPTQYNVSGPQPNQFQGQGPPQVWNQPGQQPKPFDDHRHPNKRPDMPKQINQDYDKRGHFSQTNRQSPSRDILMNAAKNYPDSGRPYPRQMSPGPVREFSPSGRLITPAGRKFSPPGRKFSPPGRKFSPPGRKYSPGRRMSPSRRGISPSNRRMSPSGRKFSPSRRMSPSGPKFGRKFSPSDRRMSPSGRKFSPSDRRMSPGRKFSPSDRRMSPSGRKFSPSDRRISPTRKYSPSGRRQSPPGRKFSPPNRRVSPGRRFSPSGRKISPSDRKYSPSGRMSPGKRGRFSPTDRMMARDGARPLSPSMRHNYYVEDDLRNRMGRRESPRRLSPKRLSPGRRLVSPPRSNRYSPSRREKSADDKSKAIRPAYEPNQAQNQSYSGGFRDVPYSGRQETRPFSSQDKGYPPNAKKDLIRIEFLRRSEAAEKPQARGSRSPTRRERSPLKDRVRRQSPSSRSPLSPRRSWALEKRNSPEDIREPPPPPIWPGQEPEKKIHKPRFDLGQEPVPVWERLDRRVDDSDLKPKVRVRSDLGDKFKPLSFQREPEEERDYSSKRERDRDYHHSEPRRDESPKQDRTVLAEIDKDFQDVYQRAVEFRRKAEELKKTGEVRRDYDDRRKEGDNEIRHRRERSPPRNRSEERTQKKHEESGKGGDMDIFKHKRMFIPAAVRIKREKAIDEISYRILNKYEMNKEQTSRITEELKIVLMNIFMHMFDDKDISFIELVVKYNARYPPKEEEKMMQQLLSTMPLHCRNLKRKTEDKSNIPAKTSRHSPPREAKEETVRPRLADSVIPGWNVGLEPPKMLNMPLAQTMEMNSIMNMSPTMVPPPMYVPQAVMSQRNMYETPQTSFEPSQPAADEIYNLYLCQDDFEPFSDLQADYLKNFLVAQMIKVTETNQGWAPDFTLKGLQSMYRYEVSTRDEPSKEWLVNLDFSEFEFFNVLVYTKEELWYERAAIWLPGHSRVRSIEPLEKLKLQNMHLEGVAVGKWKFVKKIITEKGTRLYVDMPPSSARALEKHKMMLSYELQKVSVFLKAIAVDKDSFDAGLKESSLSDHSTLISAVHNSPMSTLNEKVESGLIKIGLNGNKTITVEQARKIKEVIVYQLFKYYKNDGNGKTDFLKYGFCTTGFFGIIPENKESKRWLLGRHFGKINKHAIVVFGNDDDNTKYFKMTAYIPHANHASVHVAFERLKQSNKGIKGINFNLWKPYSIKNERKRAVLTLDVDLESVETLIKLKYKLDYVGEFGTQRVDMKCEYSHSRLEEKIKRYKNEQVDTYDEAKMDLDSDDDDEGEDIICLD